MNLRFRLKSSSFHIGQWKASIEHFTDQIQFLGIWIFTNIKGVCNYIRIYLITCIVISVLDSLKDHQIIRQMSQLKSVDFMYLYQILGRTNNKYHLVFRLLSEVIF